MRSSSHGGDLQLNKVYYNQTLNVVVEEEEEEVEVVVVVVVVVVMEGYSDGFLFVHIHTYPSLFSLYIYKTICMYICIYIHYSHTHFTLFSSSQRSLTK